MQHSSPSTRFAIFASGRGSNAESLMNAFASGFVPATLALVFSNNPAAPVLERARERGFDTAVLGHQGKSRREHELEILQILRTANIDHILLAGYMRILSPGFLEQFPGRILNIHPSLLPDFPGLHAAERQWRAGRQIVGATVHQVDAGVDTGPIVLQGSIVARGDENEAELAQRILHEVEHEIYPRAVRLFLERLNPTRERDKHP